MNRKKYGLRVVLIVILALLSPFIYPIALRILIKINIFHSVNEYILFMSTFSNKYTIISVITVISIVFFALLINFQI